MALLGECALLREEAIARLESDPLVAQLAPLLVGTATPCAKGELDLLEAPIDPLLLVT